MQHGLAVAALLILFCTAGLGGQKVWTPRVTNEVRPELQQWHDPTNWYPHGVPTREDDVVISTWIFVTQPAECRNLTLSKATLTLFAPLVVEQDARIVNFGMVDPVDSLAYLEVGGRLELDGTLLVREERSFSSYYRILPEQLIVGDLGVVITVADGREYAGIPQRAPLKDWRKVRFPEGICALRTWDGGAGTTNWNDAANWNPDSVPVNGSYITIDTTVTINVNLAASVTLNGGANNIATAANTQVTLSMNAGGNYFLMFSAGNATHNYGTGTNSSVTFTQAADNAQGRFSFQGNNATHNFGNVTFEVRGTAFTGGTGSNYVFGANPDYVWGTTTVWYRRTGDQSVDVSLPDGTPYQTLRFSGSGTKTLEPGTCSVTNLVLDNDNFTLDTQFSTDGFSVTNTPTTQGNNTYIVRGWIGTNYNGFPTTWNGTVRFIASNANQNLPSGYTFNGTVTLEGNNTTKNMTGNFSAATVFIGTGSDNPVLNMNGYKINPVGSSNSVTVRSGATLRIPNAPGASPDLPGVGFTNLTTQPNSTVIYNRNGDQNIFNTTYHNLQLTTGGIKTFPQADVTVKGTLTVGSGAKGRTQGTYKVILDRSTGATLSETATGDDGKLYGTVEATENINAAGTTYSFGNIGLSITTSSSATNFLGTTTVTRYLGSPFVRDFSNVLGPGVPGNVLRGYKLLAANQGNVAGHDITLSYNPNNTVELNGQNPNAMRVYRWVGHGFTDLFPRASDLSSFGYAMGSASSVTVTLSTFQGIGQTPIDPSYGNINGEFYFSNGRAGDFALPVQLESFAAHPSREGILLSWRTASEERNLGFRLWRRDDGLGDGPFELIASYEVVPELRGIGSAPFGRQYAYVDRHRLQRGHPYTYVLESVDEDGTVHFLRSLTVVYDYADEFHAKIRPSVSTGDEAKLVVYGPVRGTVELTLYSVDGQRVQEVRQDGVERQLEVPLSFKSLAAGTYEYVVRVRTEDGQLLQSRGRFVLLR
ncbi:MAG: hypothetical protein NZ960_02905 [Candidatus Kapabacteria bacterium]|nr:hypothetical protein [Candidatus Kapabacteria bacterium]MDW8012390.1 hypothetical protein [Bacteroidota bacterium]